MTIFPVKEHTYLPKFSISIDREFDRRVRRASVKHGVSISAFIKTVVNEWLDHNGD